MTNPLDASLAWYTTARDSLRVTRRVLDTDIAGAISDKHIFFTQTDEEKRYGLEHAQRELDRLVVLGITAIFERTLRDHLRGRLIAGDSPLDPNTTAFHKAITEEIEFWKFSPRLIDLFPSVDTQLRGQVKQIIRYRNDVAHGKPPSHNHNTNPVDAFLRLTDFLAQSGVLQ